MAEPIQVLIADDMSKKAVEILHAKRGFSVDVKTGHEARGAGRA